MDWFERLTGFREGPYDEVRRRLVVDGERLRAVHDGRAWSIGRLGTPSLGELRRAAEPLAARTAGPLRVRCVVGDVRALHRDPAHAGALFQVASQFNLLEMVGPDVTPEHGVARYAHDATQGPACAIAAGAATLYRNYFVPVDGVPGQTQARQIDCLRDVGEALGNADARLWTMRNGYALCTEAGLAQVDAALRALDDAGRDALRDRLRIGVHTDVEVTDGVARGTPGPHVTQAFCSALPVAYTRVPRERWAAFARLVLEGAYEATLWAALANAQRTGNRTVLLTQLGGGAFGNDAQWIRAAQVRALDAFRDVALDVVLVAYGQASREQAQLVERYRDGAR